ncbi:MAG: LOG family protein [Ignavibacteriales bacterium]|nr:LOG family protein [Ignavibacteriales bacterium]
MVVTVFGSGRCLPSSQDYRLARDLGAMLAQAGHTVCNGGYAGIMEASARGAREVGGSTVGVTVETFGQPANRWIEREVRTKSLAERLLKLLELGEAYVVLKGGTGTLLELAAVWEFINKQQMVPKPIVLAGFWKPVVRLIEAEVKSEGMPPAAALRFASAPTEYLDALRKP